MTPKPVNLIVCILMDLVGYLSFSIPFLGEFGDLVWAPLSAYIFYKLFGGNFGKMGGIFNFIEEALPFTDMIPTFTIAWFVQEYKRKRNISEKPTIR